jgi:HK97 family phage portal protein
VRLFGLEIQRRAPAGLQAVSSNRGSWWPVIREPSTSAWQRNQEWTTDTVLAHHAVYACITRIAQDIGKLRPKLVERDENGIWSEVENAAHSPALRRPNRFQNHIQFKEWWAASKLIRGNTYVLIERDLRGVPSAFYVLDPSRVQVLVAPDGAVFYELQTDNLAGLEQERVAVPASEIIHDRMNCLYHPLVGTSPIFACGAAANLGLQIQTNSASFFGNGSNPSGILTTTTPITPEQATQLSDQWAARFGPGAPGGVAVLGFGMQFEAMRMTAVDSQTIEQLGWTAETVCSTFHVPSWKIGVGEQPAYTKPEIANQAYYSDCLQSPIEQWELCMDEAFGFTTTTEGRWLGVELDLDGLLRMDVAGQYDVMVKAAGGAVLTPDEARRKLDQSPLPGGHTLYRQQQEYSLEALAKRDAKDDPFGTDPAPALPAPEPQKQITAGDPVAAEEDRSASFGFLVRDCMAQGFTAMAATLDAQRAELLSFRTEIETRALPAPEPLPVVVEPVVEPESDSLERWDGWFARDALVMVREAQATQSRAVDDIGGQRFAEFSASTRAAIDTLTATVQTLAARETVVHVDAPQIHIAPTAVTVEPPDVHVAVTMPTGKVVSRSSTVIRDDVGAIVGVTTTEETAG